MVLHNYRYNKDNYIAPDLLRTIDPLKLIEYVPPSRRGAYLQLVNIHGYSPARAVLFLQPKHKAVSK